jgi:exopolysaccharide production protein ExoQ
MISDHVLGIRSPNRINPRPPGFSRFRFRSVALALGGLLVAGIVFFGSAVIADKTPFAPFIPIGLLVCGLGGWLVLAAAYGSPMAIMLYFSAVAFMTDSQFRVRGAGDISGDWQSALKFLIWMGAGVIGFAHMPSLPELLKRPGAACWLAYIAVAIASSIYSPVAGYSFGCALALLCLFAFAFSLTTRLTEGQILWTLLLSLTVFNIGGWIIFYAVPDLGVSAAWTTSGMMMRMCGLAGQATNLGAVCAKAVGAAFVLWYTRRSGPITALILGGFAFATLLKSDARTTEIATVAGIAIVLASRSAWLTIGGGLAMSAMLLLLQIFPGLIGAMGSQFSRSGDPTEVYTLTGRLEIWDFAWRQIKLSPILGYGYNSSKAVLGSYLGFENGLMVDSAHNLYLQNLLSVGVLGLIPLVILLGYLTYRCVVRPIPIVCYILVLVFISSISDTDAIGTTPTLMTVVFFMVSLWPGLESPGRVAMGPRLFGPTGTTVPREGTVEATVETTAR